MQANKKFRLPLGGDLYAYVATSRRDGVKIHIRHFQLAMDTKGGVKPTSKGVKMDAKTLRRLFAVKKQLTEAFKLQTAKTGDVKPRSPLLKKPKGLRLQLPEVALPLVAEPEPELRQQISWPPNDNNYPAAFVDVGALTPSYSYNAT